MVAIWTEDTLVQPGKTVTRGFGGRIYFYNEKSQAIPVEGELIVYGYDDSSAASAHSLTSNVEATKKFAFTPEQFTQHFSQSDLGASYSIWIPWMSRVVLRRRLHSCLRSLPKNSGWSEEKHRNLLVWQAASDSGSKRSSEQHHSTCQRIHACSRTWKSCQSCRSGQTIDQSSQEHQLLLSTAIRQNLHR